MSRSALLWAIGGLGAAGAFLWCLLAVPGMRAPLPIGDGAVTELYTLHASRGWWEYGPYSRFGWHHPGPLFFYLLAPFYLASRAETLALNGGALAINLIALTTIVWALARHASAALVVAVTAALALYLWRMPLLLVSAWNPHIVLLPLAALIVSSSITAAGRLSLLPVTIVMATFVSQTHLGLLPCAAAAVACALVAGLRSTEAPRRLFWLGIPSAPAQSARRIGLAMRSKTALQGISGLIGIILWLPPIVEQVTSADGNMSKIARFFLLHDSTDTGIPLMTALRAWAAAMVGPLAPVMSFPTGGALAPEASTPIVAIVAVSVVMLIAAGWRTSRSAVDAVDSVGALGAVGAVDAWFCRICVLLSIVAIAAVVRVRGGLQDHVVSWVTVIGVMSIAALAAALASRIAATLAGASTPNTRLKWLVPVTASACLIAAAVHGLIGLERLRAERIALAPRAGEIRAPADSIYGTLQEVLANAHIRRPLIRVAGTWDSAAAIVLQLHKRRQPVAVSDDAVWLVGAQFAKDGSEDAELTLADRAFRHDIRQRDGDCMLIERHGLSLHVLMPSLRAPVSLRCE